MAVAFRTCLPQRMVATVLNTAMAVVGLGLLALTAWAFIDCALRPAPAFPAVDRQTKVAWLIFLGLAIVVQMFFGGFSLLGFGAVVVAVYYLVDVRTKVVRITRSNR